MLLFISRLKKKKNQFTISQPPQSVHYSRLIHLLGSCSSIQAFSLGRFTSLHNFIATLKPADLVVVTQVWKEFVPHAICCMYSARKYHYLKMDLMKRSQNTAILLSCFSTEREKLWLFGLRRLQPHSTDHLIGDSCILLPVWVAVFKVPVYSHQEVTTMNPLRT